MNLINLDKVNISKNKSHHKHYKGTQQIEDNIYVIWNKENTWDVKKGTNKTS